MPRRNHRRGSAHGVRAILAAAAFENLERRLMLDDKFQITPPEYCECDCTAGPDANSGPTNGTGGGAGGKKDGGKGSDGQTTNMLQTGWYRGNQPRLNPADQVSSRFPEGASGPSIYSPHPVRYFDGQVKMSRTDLSSSGLGSDFGITRSYTHQLAGDIAIDSPVNIGPDWAIDQVPYLHVLEGTSPPKLKVAFGATNSRTFRKFGDDWVSWIVSNDTLIEGDGTFTLTDIAGYRWVFADTGKILSTFDPSGLETLYTYDVDNLESISRTDGVVTESLEFTYSGDPANVSTITLMRGELAVRRVRYEYDDSGPPNRLMRATVEEPDDPADPSDWRTVNVDFYHYYVGQTEERDPGEPSVPLIKHVSQGASYDRLVAELERSQ